MITPMRVAICYDPYYIELERERVRQLHRQERKQAVELDRAERALRQEDASHDCQKCLHTQSGFCRSDKYMAEPKPRCPGWSWRWDPKLDNNRYPLGQRFSVRDIPGLDYRPEQKRWIEESLRVRGSWRRDMAMQRDKDSFSAWDAANGLWRVM